MTKEEFNQSVLPLKNKLFGFSFRYLKCSEEAKDVVQDVMLKIWEAKRPVSDYNNLEAWCMTLVRNQFLDKLKRKGRNHLAVEDQFDLADDVTSPHRGLEERELVREVEKCIEKLPDRQRTVIELRDFQGKTYKQIAEICETDINVVKVSIFRARKAIKEQLEKLNEHGLQHKTN